MPKINNRYVGIDPGGQGGIVFLKGEKITLHRMPDTDPELWELIESIKRGPSIVRVAVERVSAFHGSSATSAFTFGFGYGKLIMGLTAAKVPFVNPLPQEWMKYMGIIQKKKKEKGKDKKERLREIAQQMFPNCELWKETKARQLELCDALLLAEYARRSWK